jgi:hypothetical protein
VVEREVEREVEKEALSGREEEVHVKGREEKEVK